MIILNKYLLQDYLLESANKYPQKTAIVYEENKVTYQGLLRWSRQVANQLHKMGFSARNAVCLYLEKSMQEIAAMFGVLFCNGFYIPLDTVASPVRRCLTIIEKSASDYIITDKKNYEILLANTDLEWQKEKKILVLDEKIMTTPLEDGQEVSLRQGISQDLAYILYTSGSTGEPKGAMLTHRNATAFINWCLHYFKPDEKEQFISITPFHFDLSIFDIYVSIASGGCLYIPSRQEEENPLQIINILRREKVTYLYSVPSLWIAFVKYGKIEKGTFPSLKKVLFAGESFPLKYLKKGMELVPQAEFYNLYGLIETNVFTFYKVEKKDLGQDMPIPIGYVCEDSEAVIIKDNREVTEVLEEGELCVRGSTVMKGYYREKELTAKSFMISPIPHHHGELLYKTGDIVMRNEKGAFVLIGRNDFIVKKNGYRIGLPEIEAAIYTFPFVQEAAVIAFKQGEEVMICAGIQKTKENQIKILEFKQKLRDRIPKYMIPDFIAFLQELPHNQNGKIDRQKLKKYFIDQQN